MDNIIEFIDVSKSYEKFKLDNVSFSHKKGFVMGLVGANGAGKTTIIKLIMNLLKKQSGQIKVFGLDNVQHEKEIKEKIGFVYDENIYFENLKLKKIAELIAPFYKQWDWNAFRRYLNTFDLDEDIKLIKCSKGMKMKFAIAVALSHNAEFIIMDEPTSGLDPVFRRELLDILYEVIQNEERSILFSTHITSDLEKIADYITFLDKGKVVLSEAYSNIIDNYRIIKGPKGLEDRIDKSLLAGYQVSKFGFSALTGNVDKFSTDLGEEIIIEKPSIEDIMVYHAKNLTNPLNTVGNGVDAGV